MYFATSFGAPGAKSRCSSVLHFNSQYYLLSLLLWELLHNIVLRHFTEQSSERTLFPDRTVHKMTTRFFIPLETSWEVGHSFLPFWTDFLPILHGQEEIAQWCWLSATEGVASWDTDDARWYSDVLRVESAYRAEINPWTPSWAPPSSPAFLDLFTVLLVIQTFEAPGICLFFPTTESCSHLHIIPCLNFPNQCLDIYRCFARKTRKSTFLLLRISEAFLRGRKNAVFFEQRTDYLNSDRGMGRDRNTVCRKYSIYIRQPT